MKFFIFTIAIAAFAFSTVPQADAHHGRQSRAQNRAFDQGFRAGANAQARANGFHSAGFHANNFGVRGFGGCVNSFGGHCR